MDLPPSSVLTILCLSLLRYISLNALRHHVTTLFWGVSVSRSWLKNSLFCLIRRQSANKRMWEVKVSYCSVCARPNVSYQTFRSEQRNLKWTGDTSHSLHENAVASRGTWTSACCGSCCPWCTSAFGGKGRSRCWAGSGVPHNLEVTWQRKWYTFKRQLFQNPSWSYRHRCTSCKQGIGLNEAGINRYSFSFIRFF